jgi:DNA-damage-inducible protein J
MGYSVIGYFEEVHMGESRLSIRVDEKAKKKAEAVFHKLGLSMSAGITIYLNRVALEQAVPFPLTLSAQPVVEEKIKTLENTAKAAVYQELEGIKAKGLPVALYDFKHKRPYLEYPDGRKEYNLGR